MPQDKAWFTTVVPVDPDSINADYSYIVQCPEGATPLAIKQVENFVFVVVQVPIEASPISLFRLWVYPGRDAIREHWADARYIGTAIVFEADKDMLDWHFYLDTTGAIVQGDPHATVH